MSLTGDFFNGLEKRKKRKDDIAPIRTTTKAKDDDIAPVLVPTKAQLLTAPTVITTPEIAPEKEWYKKIVKKPDLFDDGYQAGDISKTILGTGADFSLNVLTGVGNFAEGIGDTINYGIADIFEKVGNKDFANVLREETKKSVVQKLLGETTETVDKWSVLDGTSDSVAQGLGMITTFGAGGMALGGAGIGAAGQTALSTGGTLFSGIGSGMSEAYEGGATDEEARTYGLISGTADALSELIFGGLGKGINAVGFSKGLSSADDMLAKKISNMFSSQIAKNLTQYGIKAGAEGLEEVLSGLAQGIGKKITYMSEEELDEILKDENLLEQFVVGSVTSAIAQSGDFYTSAKNKTDFITGSTKSEQNTVDKLVEEKVAEATKKQAIEKAVNKAIEERETEQGGKLSDDNKKALREAVKAQIESGEIDISSEKLSKKDIAKIEKEIKSSLDDGKIEVTKIEEILTPDETKQINELKETLDNTKDEQKKAEIEGKIKQLETARLENLKSQARDNKYLRTAIAEYNASKTTYQDDSEVTDEYEKAVVESAKKYANNTKLTRKFVDIVRKLAKDRQTRYIFTNNQALLEQGDLKVRDDISAEDQAKIKSLEKQLSEATTKEAKADIQAQIIALKYYDTGGLVRKNENGVETVIINVDSIQSKYSVAGHETKHILEKYELNEKFNELLFEYAKNKGDLDAARSRIESVYKNQEDVDIDGEVAAELTGKYLFEDEKFLDTLMKNKSDSKVQQIIEKIKELIDDLVVRFKGTDQEKQLREVQKKFTELYNSTDADIVAETTEGTRYSIDNNQNLVYNDSRGERYVRTDEFKRLQAECQGMSDEDIQLYHSGNRKIDEKLRADIAGILRTQINSYRDGLRDDNGILNLVNKGNEFNMCKSVDGSLFHDVFEIAQKYLLNGELVDLHTVETTEDGIGYDDCYNYLSEDGLSGFSITPDGDLISVFNASGKSGFLGAIAPFVKENSKTLDCYNSPNQPLCEMYERMFGFKTASVMDYNMEYDHDNIAENHNKPKVAFMVNTENHVETKNFTKDEYDEAVAYRNSFINQAGSNGSASSIAEKKQYSLSLEDIETKYKDKTDYLFLHERNDTISISNMVVKEEYRNQGIGTQILNDVIAYADENGKTITLTPTTEFGTQNKLKKWYKANGFVENKGRNADLRLSDTMYRLPKKSNIKKAKPQKQFSLSNPVEETKDLVAVHGMAMQNLMDSLALGGLPMPSIAIIKARMGHNKYGDVSLVFGKETIDPELNNANKVYGLDVWSPVYPTIEFKVNEAVSSKIRDKYYKLGKEYGYDNVKPLYAYAEELERQLNIAEGEQGLLEKLYNDVGLMNVYLLDSGKPKVEPVTVEERTVLSDMDVESFEFLIAEIGRDVIDEFILPEGVRGPWAQEHKKAFWDKHLIEVQKAYGNMFIKLDNFTEEEANKIVDNTSRFELNNWLNKIVSYIKNGKVKIKVTEDRAATEEAIKKAAQDGYVEWVDDLFKGVAEKSGIRNNVDYFDKYGNRRDWEALHYANKLENVVKVMKGQENGTSFFNAGALWAIAAKDYGTIQEIKADSDRLKLLSEDEYSALKKAIGARVDEIADSLNSKYSDSNYFIDHDNKINNLFDAIKSSKTKSGVLKYLNQYFTNATEATVTDLLDVIADAGNLPTEYFEAKPQRAVMFDEVKAVIIPDNAPQELKKQLDSMGLNVLTYEHGNDNSRTEVLNSIEDVKFSLAKQDENVDYSKSLRSIKYQPMDDLPIREDVAKNTTTTFDDIAPLREDEANAMREEQDNIAPFTDADVPPEIDVPMYDAADTTKIDDTVLKGIGQRLRETLTLTTKETKAIQEVVQQYSTTEIPNNEQLFNEIKEKFSEKSWKERNEEIAEIKMILKGFKIKVSDNIKNDIADYGEWQKHNWGKLNFSKDGLTVDDIYESLSISYPGFFPSDVVNPTDQLLLISEVAGMDTYAIGTHQLDDDIIQQATDIVISEVNKYKENELAQQIAEEQSHFYRGLVEEETAEYSKAKTVKERIADEVKNARAELLMNQQLRDESRADYEKEISRLQAEYNGKRDKNTKAANNILRRIERLQRMKNDVDADYSKRISDIENRIAKLESKDYATVEQRKTKQQELRTQMENLVGDTSTWVDKKLGVSYKVNTLRRNLRDIVRDENGKRDIAKADAIYDELQGKYNHNEAELNREANRIKQQFAKMKITSAEDTYIQMLGELRHNPETTLTEDVVKDFYNKHKKNIDEAKVDKAIEMARPLYDDLLSRVNQVLSEQGMKEIPYRKGYFPHFTEDKQGFLAKLFNWKTKNNDIPTDIAGLTEEFNPNRSWQSFNKQRKTDTTDYSFLKGLDSYVQGSLDWIYHIEDIQKRRALENHIRYVHSEQGIKERIDAIRNNEEYDANEMQDQIDLVYKEAGNPLNNFITDFRTATNTLAGKKSSLDRGMEEMTNRQFYSTMTNLSNRVSANMVGGSISSALTNFIPITQSWGQVSPISSLKAMGETIRSTFRDDGTIDKSDFLTNRLRKSENLYKDLWDKFGDGIGILMESIDSFTSQTVWRSKYLENISKGMSENAAIKDADQFAENVLAGRSRGNNPTIFDSKNPLAKTLTVFQLEVNNQYGYMFKDMPQDLANESKRKLVQGYVTMFLGAYAYNALYSSLVGRDAAFDPIGIIEDLLRDLGFGGDDEEEEEIAPTDAILNLTNNVLEELPFVGGLLGGGRIPLSSAMPYGGITEAFEGTLQDLSEGNTEALTKEWLNPVWYLAMPMGGGQIKKSWQGLKMFDDDLPIAGSYTDSGNLRFPVEDTPLNRVQAGLFGQYANENARAYFDNDIAPLKEKQIQEFIDVDIPIADYWKYREGLKGLETLNEKGDYIGDLDLPISKKNILINNIADRDKPIDYKDFDLYSDFEEFDFATRYPEKYAVLKEQGISVAEYKEKYEETAFMYTDDFAWASNNPEKYTLSKAVTNDVTKYKQYTTDLYNIKADKDSNGKSISGSRKKKVLDYINDLNIDYGAKCILLKSEYSSEDRYNKAIVDYLNSRDDITTEEKRTILEELGATIDSNGYIHW